MSITVQYDQIPVGSWAWPSSAPACYLNIFPKDYCNIHSVSFNNWITKYGTKGRKYPQMQNSMWKRFLKVLFFFYEILSYKKLDTNPQSCNKKQSLYSPPPPDFCGFHSNLVNKSFPNQSISNLVLIATAIVCDLLTN